jgi:endonuclease YncB( thermonuclease family)
MNSLGPALLLVAAAFPAAAQTSGSMSGVGAPVNCTTTMGELPKTWEGKAYAVSGDTLAGIGLKARLRLWGIHAPELAGNFARNEGVPAMRARAALEDMLAAGEHLVSCRTTGWDSACRAVAQCTITAEWPTGSKAQPHDLGLRLVEDGFAYGFELESPPGWDKDASEKIAHFEAISRQDRKGLWPTWLGERAKP